MEKPEDNPYVEPQAPEFDDIDEMSEDEAREQVEKLREAVGYHDYRYYVENDPVVSDKTYDVLYDRLETLEDKFGLSDEGSPTQRVGGEPLDELETREHVVEMLSIDSSEDEDEVRAFDERVREDVGDVDYHVEPKFDGFSIELVYDEGTLTSAVTRGDGVVGEDVTENVRTVQSVPLRLRGAPEQLVLRGEVYMPKDGFQELNKERVELGETPFANPRNAAVGTIRRLDPSVVAERPLDIYVYDVMRTTAEVGTQTEAVELLESLNFRVNEKNRLVGDIDSFVEYRNELLEEREELGYEVDGVIAKVDDFSKRETLGETSAHPRWSFAYKFPAKTDMTRVADIAVQVGRTGKLTPVALLEPVELDGVTVSRASLHNQKQVRELGVREGATVEIERAGDVIPQVKRVVEEEDEEGKDADVNGFMMPDTCPVCGSEVVRDGEHHYCSGGVACPAQLKRRLEHFASRDAMDIDGMGEQVVSLLVEEGIVESLPDLYDLRVEDLSALEGFGEMSAKKLVEEIEASKDATLAEFLTALGIHRVGKERARKLADEFSLDELIEADEAELLKVEDVGPEVAESVTGFFGDGGSGRGREVVEELLDRGVKPERQETEDTLKGTKIVFTGRVEGYTRNELEDLLERHGADVTSSVSGETDYLVVGENPGATKQEDAEEHGVETLDEDEFREEILSRL
ncbi:MAG: NAD-dependent DNA ligase LigA [Halobacteriales archaeon]|nr:NAD-dependent DNA ligase LigA [Halobacteriales archaeon]